MKLLIHCEGDETKFIFKDEVQSPLKEVVGEITGWFPNDDTFEIVHINTNPIHSGFGRKVIAKLKEYLVALDIDIITGEISEEAKIFWSKIADEVSLNMFKINLKVQSKY